MKNILQKKSLRAILLFALFLMLPIHTFGQLLGWNTASNSGTFGVSPWTPQTLNSGVETSGLIRGATILTSGTPANGAWGGSGSWSANGADSQSFHFTVRAKPGVAISLSGISSTTRRSNSGPQSSKVYYSISGGAFIHVADWTTGSTSATGTFNETSLSNIPALQNIQAGVIVKFRIVPQGTNGNYYITGGAEALKLLGNAQAVSQDPLITPSVTMLPAFENTTVGGHSTPKSFTFNTVGLTEDVSILASTGFEISTDGNTWYPGTDITPNVAGGINNRQIWVRFSPTSVGNATGTVTLTSTGADDKIITVSGNGILPNSIAVTPAAITGLNYLLGQGPSAAIQLTNLTTADLFPTTGNLVITPASGTASNYEVSTDGTTWGATANYAYTEANNTITNPTLYVRSKAGLPVGEIPQEIINVQGGGMNFATFTVAGSVTSFPAPIATEATDIETTSFTANWEGVQDATNYRLDVSTTPFSTTANGFIAEDFSNMTDVFDDPDFEPGTSYGQRSWTGTGNIQWFGGSVRRYPNGFVPNKGQALELNRKGVFTSSVVTSGIITGGTNKIAFDYKGASHVLGYSNGRLMVRILTGENFTTVAFSQQLDYTATAGFFEENVTGVTGDYKIEISNIATNTNTPPTGGGPLNIDNVTFNTITTTGATNFVPGFENLEVAGLSQTVTELDPNTKYYYRVRAENGALVSVNSNVIEVTTACPPAPTVNAQTFCASGTVADLLPTGLNWYDTETATTPLLPTDDLVSGTYFASQTTNGCETAKTEVIITVSTQIAPDFAPITVCSGETAPELELTSPNGITGTWNPSTIDNTTGGDYIFTPDATECALTQTLTVVVTEKTVPDFAPIADFCSGSETTVLELVSPNGISGTWTPATINNTASGDYIFTPDASECATTQTLSVVVIEKTIPDFTPIVDFCSGSEVPALELVSPNGISGTWTPATISNTASGDYIFTPDASECATTQTLSVVVIEKTVPDFAPIADFCSGSETTVLELVSPNGISGTWTPATINNTASGDYIFTPDASECATTQTLSVVVIEKTVPDFAPIADFCSGSEAPVLEATSPNRISGTWAPATISNTASSDYIFTPDASECATTQTLSVVVIEKTVPNFATIADFCSGSEAPALELVSPNGISGTWTPATISNTASGDYIFTPDASECATTQTLSVVVIEKTVPNFAPIADFCSGSEAPVLEATSPNGISGTWAPATISNTASGDYIFTPDASECATSQTLTIVINNATVAPTGEETQDFNGGDTLSDFVIIGEGIKWYDAPTAGNELPSTDLIVTGAIYYASQTIAEGCGESTERLKIIAGVDLATTAFTTTSFNYYPNPVNDFLTVTAQGTIDTITVFNLLGQQLITKRVNSATYRLDLSHLASGNYLIQANSGQNTNVFKVIKK